MMQRLTAYFWPGNVRELENILERAVILATGPTLEIGPDILGEPVSATATGPRLALEDVERNHILKRPRADRLGDRRAEGRGHSLGSPPQHPAEPAQEARYRARVPRPLVASHDIS